MRLYAVSSRGAKGNCLITHPIPTTAYHLKKSQEPLVIRVPQVENYWYTAIVNNIFTCDTYNN